MTGQRRGTALPVIISEPTAAPTSMAADSGSIHRSPGTAAFTVILALATLALVIHRLFFSTRTPLRQLKQHSDLPQLLKMRQRQTASDIGRVDIENRRDACGTSV